MIAAEYEAIQLYMQLAESMDNKLAIEVLKDIADEERVHAGESLQILRVLAPDEEKFYAKGAEEVEEEIESTPLRGTLNSALVAQEKSALTPSASRVILPV